MKTRALLRLANILFALLWVGGIAGCASQKKASPTILPTVNVTQALETVSAMLTQTAARAPGKPNVSTTVAPAREAVISPTQVETSSSPTQTHLPSGPLPTLDPSCDRVAPGNPVDKTIEDDTQMQPGEQFTKIWSLVNDGQCTWTRKYQAVWFFGEKFGDTLSVPLSREVAPGQSVEIAVDMTAPTTTGIYRGNWKLRNADGVDFGIGPNGGSPFWLRIIVVEAATATPTHTIPPSPTLTPTASPTLTPTPTLTPASIAGGPAVLLPNDLIDLDDNQINPAGQADLAYLVDGSFTHWLTPQNGAQLGVYGLIQPSVQACQASTMSNAPIAVESLSPGIYLCYRTDQDNLGWLSLIIFSSTDFSIQVEILTWAP